VGTPRNQRAAETDDAATPPQRRRSRGRSRELEERTLDASNVRFAPLDQDIDIVSGARQSVERDGVPADHHEAHAMSVQDTNKLGEVLVAHGSHA
jgi:hypothetical protein